MAKERKRKKEEPVAGAPVGEQAAPQHTEAEAHAPEPAPDTAVESHRAHAEKPDETATAAQHHGTPAATEHTAPAEPAKPAFAAKVQRADPFSFHSAHFADGYRIGVQESDSRRTVEIQFGDGSRKDQPKNFAKIKALLANEGLRWNGTNAWAIDLHSERGSFHQREEAKRRNKELRAHVEESVFPAVIGLEEEQRGPILFSDDFRSRITAASANAR